MKKTIVVAFLLIFTGLSLYFFFAEDYCHVHNSLPRGAFSHTHHEASVQTCLCFWSTLFSPGSCDFAFVQDNNKRLAVFAAPTIPGDPYDSDIAHPPKSRPA